MMENKLEYICKNCDFNYIVLDDGGMIQYCVITEIYEDDMKEIVFCSHYRVEGKYS